MQEVDGKAFEVVDRIPGQSRRSQGKWRKIFDPLEIGQVVRVECKSLDEARKLRQCAVQSIRGVKSIHYSLKSQCGEEDGKFILYLEKIERR